MSEQSPYGVPIPVISSPPTPEDGSVIWSDNTWEGYFAYGLTPGLDPYTSICDRIWRAYVTFSGDALVSHTLKTSYQPGATGPSYPTSETYSSTLSAEEWAQLTPGSYDVYFRLVLSWYYSYDGTYSGMSGVTESYTTPFTVTVPAIEPPPPYTGGDSAPGSSHNKVLAAARYSVWIAEV